MGNVQAQARAAAAKAQQEKNNQAAQNQADQAAGRGKFASNYQPKTDTFNSGFGNGRITFDKQGNTLQDGRIVAFAGRQARETYQTERGFGNNGVVTDKSKAEKANFSGVSSYNISGIRNEESTKSPDESILESYLAGGRTPDKDKSASIIFTPGKSKDETYQTPSDQFFRGSPKEDLVKQKEAERAGKIYPSSSNSDYFSGGKPNESAVEWVAPVGNQYKNMGQGINNSLVRNSPQEAKAKASEAQRALGVYNSKKDQNADYATGGTPENFGGVITGKSLGKNYGSAWVNAQLGTTQNFRGNSPQKQTQITKEGKIKSSLPGSSITDVNSQISFSNGLIDLSNKQIQEKNNQIALGNGLISLSNKQIASKNLQSETETKAYFNQGNKEGAIFIFLSGNKEVGQTSGPRSFHDFLTNQKQFGNISIEKTYPQREKELTQAVGKNPDFYLGLSRSYWQELSAKGYYTEKNAPKINSELQTHWTAQNLGLLQGTLYSEQHGGSVPSASGPIFIAPPEHEVSSFLRVPYSGGKEYNAFTGAFGLKPTQGKASTSTIPSTSWVNVAQFAPGLPVIDRLAGPASEVWVNLLSKGGIKLGELKTQINNKANTKLQEKILEKQQYFSREKQPISFEQPNQLRNQEHIRPSNMFREKLPYDILSRDKALEREPVSARPNEPRNTMFEDTTKEIQSKNTKLQNDLLTPATARPNPPASTIIPFFQGRKDQFGRLFSGNVSPTEDIGSVKAPQKTEVVSVFGKASGVSPLSFRETGFSGVSPISRDFMGVHYEGVYPTSYLPPAAAFASKSETPISIDTTYNPAARSSLEYSRYNKLNIGGILGSSITPKEETTDVGLTNLLKGMTEKIKPNKNEVLHGTDLLSGLNIQQKGPKITLEKGKGFHVTQEPFLALAFANFRTEFFNKTGVILKFNVNADLLSKATGGRKYLKAESVPKITQKQHSAIEGFDILAHPLTQERMQEILVTKKDFLVGKPKIIDVTDIVNISRIKPKATGLSPLEYHGYSTGSDVGTLRYGETLEKRDVIPIYGETKKQLEQPEVFFNPSGKNRVPSPLETGERNYNDFISSKHEKEIASRNENPLDILSQTLSTKEERLQNYPQKPTKSQDILDTGLVKNWHYGGKVPIDVYKSSLGHSETNINAKEFFGLAGERVGKNTGKYVGKLPLESYGLIPQQGLREGDIAFFNKDTGGVKRVYVSPPEKTGTTGPLDIWSEGSTKSGGKFKVSKGAKFYESADIYQYGSSFPRGTLQNKDVGLIKFEKYQKSHPELQSIGNARIESFFKNLPSRATKAPTGQQYKIFNEKDLKISFRRTSKSMFEPKPKEPNKKEVTFKNTSSSQQQSVLLQKPLTRRRIITSQEQQYDYGYEFKPLPATKSESGQALGLISGIKLGFLSGVKSKQSSQSLYSNLNKTLELTKIKSTQNQTPKQTGRMFVGQTGKQTPKLMPKLFTTPKQSTKPKQIQKQIPLMASPQQPKQGLRQPQEFIPQRPNTTQRPPRRPLITLLLGGGYSKDRRNRSKNGPTALENLNVNNIFSSSLSINIKKNNRIEF